MALVKCEKQSHMFDAGKHSNCPICGSYYRTVAVPQTDSRSANINNSKDNNEPSSSSSNSNGYAITEDPSYGKKDTSIGDFGFPNPHISFKQLGTNQETADWLEKKFRIERLLAQGGMGQILLCEERLSGRFVALKVMLESTANMDEYVQQFVREAIITARFQHPNIIPIYDLGFLSESKLYYTMRFVYDAQDFSDMIYDDNIEILEKVRILRNAAMAIHYAHERGYWHRDLKPENILIGPLGDTYVIDWGLVSLRPGTKYKLDLPRIVIDRRTYNIPDQLFERTKGAITESGGCIIGTPAYMSPEQARSGSMGPRCDIWALGVILYEVITGSHPVHGCSSPVQFLHRVAFGEQVFSIPGNVKEAVPKRLIELCGHMLARDSNQRLPDLDIFIRDTGTLLRGAGLNTSMIQLPSARPSNPVDRPSESEIALLRYQNKFLSRRNEILAELASLGVFAFRRKKQLRMQLDKL